MIAYVKLAISLLDVMKLYNIWCIVGLRHVAWANSPTDVIQVCATNSFWLISHSIFFVMMPTSLSIVVKSLSRWLKITVFKFHAVRAKHPRQFEPSDQKCMLSVSLWRQRGPRLIVSSDCRRAYVRRVVVFVRSMSSRERVAPTAVAAACLSHCSHCKAAVPVRTSSILVKVSQSRIILSTGVCREYFHHPAARCNLFRVMYVFHSLPHCSNV